MWQQVTYSAPSSAGAGDMTWNAAHVVPTLDADWPESQWGIPHVVRRYESGSVYQVMHHAAPQSSAVVAKCWEISLV